MIRLIQLSDEDIMKIDVTWETFSYPELKAKIRKLYDDQNNELYEIADLLSALYWDVIILKQKEIRKKSENNECKKMRQMRSVLRDKATKLKHWLKA